MVYTSCQTTSDLKSLEITRFQKNLKTAQNYSLVAIPPPRMRILSILVKIIKKYILSFP